MASWLAFLLLLLSYAPSGVFLLNMRLEHFPQKMPTFPSQSERKSNILQSFIGPCMSWLLPLRVRVLPLTLTSKSKSYLLHTFHFTYSSPDFTAFLTFLYHARRSPSHSLECIPEMSMLVVSPPSCLLKYCLDSDFPSAHSLSPSCFCYPLHLPSLHRMFYVVSTM